MSQSQTGEHKGWTVTLGILLIIAGFIVLGSKFFFAATTLYFFGWVLLFSGIIQIFYSLFTGSLQGFFMVFLSGVLNGIIGAAIIVHPGVSIAAITLLIAAFFFVDGIVKMAHAFAGQERHKGLTFFEGIVVFLLGVFMWNLGPGGNLIVIGFLIGAGLIVGGISTILNVSSQEVRTTQSAYR